MNNMLNATEMTTKVNDSLSRLFVDKTPRALYEPITYTLSAGGKRIRPVLMLLVYSMFRNDFERIMPVACGLEVYHNYTLLHDDLMDSADLRRGKPTVHKKWNTNTAILSGDSMLVLAYQLVAEAPSDKLKEIVDLFTTTALKIGEGQQYDMDFENRLDVSEKEYVEMIRLKTSVLLACAMKMGAILGEASQLDAEKLYRCGEAIGLAFQLQDDYLDVYGTPEVFGKAIGGDILSNKKTYMLITALKKSEGAQHKELCHWLEAKQFDPQEKINAVKQIYSDLGIDVTASEKIACYFAEGCDLLNEVGVDECRKENLCDFINSMMFRKK